MYKEIEQEKKLRLYLIGIRLFVILIFGTLGACDMGTLTIGESLLQILILAAGLCWMLLLRHVEAGRIYHARLD